MAEHLVNPSRPAGHLALILALLLTSVAVAGPAGAATDNPSVGQTCGADLVLLLDASSSIQGLGGATDSNGAADEVVAAAAAFLDSVSGTGARVAIISYDAEAIVQTDFMGVTRASTSLGGVHHVALGDPGGANGPVPAGATGYSAHVRDGVGTNWEAGLAEARRQIERARLDRGTAVVHITDGVPTWHVRADDTSTGTGTGADHVAHAAVEADRVKTLGAHLYAVGVGPAADHVAALTAIAGPDIYDQSDPTDVLDPVEDDVLLVSDPERLETSLIQFARAACGSVLRVRVLVADSAEGPFLPASDWIVSAAPASVRGYAWVTPDARPDASKTALTDVDRPSRFAWSVAETDAWVPRVDVDVPMQAGYVAAGGACRHRGGDPIAIEWGTGDFDVPLGVADAVTCELRAVASAEADMGLDVSLTALADSEPSCPGHDGLTVAADFVVTFCAAITNSSDRTASDVRADIDGIAWSPEIPDEIAAGETIRAVVTVPMTEDVVAVMTAAATVDDSPVTGRDKTSVSVVQPALVLEKSVDRTMVPVGTAVTYELVVRNLGAVRLADLVVDDPDCGALSGPARVDDNGDDLLDFGEVWTFTCSATISADFLNVARASAWAVDRAGERIPGGGVQARSNASVSVTSSVAGSTQTSSGADSLSQTGAEILGLIAGGLGLIGLGFVLLAARRRRE